MGVNELVDISCNLSEDANIDIDNDVDDNDQGGICPPPFWKQKAFLSVSFFRKLIVHENLYLKLFCSSKIVDFRAIFVKNSAAQAYFSLLIPNIQNLAPPFSNASYGPEVLSWCQIYRSCEDPNYEGSFLVPALPLP